MPPLFEMLERRTLLTAALQQSFAEFFGPAFTDDLVESVEGSTDSGNYIWSGQSRLGLMEWVRFPDGSIRRSEDIHSRIENVIWVADNGVMLAWVSDADNPDEGAAALFDLSAGGGPEFYKDQPPAIIGPTIDFTTTHDIEVVESGHIFLFGNGGTLYERDIWVYHEGTLEFLWRGTFVDAADGGIAVGQRGTATEIFQSSGTPVFWSPDTGLREITGMRAVGALNDLGQALGNNHDGDLVLADLHLGTVRTMVPLPDTPEGHVSGFRVDDLNNNGLARVTLETRADGVTTSRRYLVLDTERPIIESTRFIGTPEARFPRLNINDRGEMFWSGNAYTLFDREEETTTSETALTVHAQDSVLSFLIDRFGDVRTLITDSGGTRLGSLIDAADGGVNALASFTDPADGSALLFIADADGQRLFSFDRDATSARSHGVAAVSDGDLITHGLVSFRSDTGGIAVAGLTASGSVSLFFDDDAHDGVTELSESSGLSADHLTPQGLETPAYVGPLTGYATPWNGMNIAGLNVDGEVEVVWWAPGMTLWRTDNISRAAGAPALTGVISGFVTDFGTISIAGADAEGNVQVIWWNPSLGAGNWRTTNLTAQIGGPTVDPGSLAGFVTDWGGISIAAIDNTTGELLFYWWTPGRDSWVAETVETIDGTGGGLVGRLAVAEHGETLSVVGVDAGGHLQRFSWSPNPDNLWAQQDLTELAEL